jgi:hypothetical protein
MKDDPTITRIREVRHHISEACGHDPETLVQYYIEFQKQYQSRLVRMEETKEELKESSIKA